MLPQIPANKKSAKFKSSTKPSKPKAVKPTKPKATKSPAPRSGRARVQTPRERVSSPRPVSGPEVATVKLEDWSCTSRNPYVDPTVPYNLCLQGTVKGHPKIPDGEHIVTSPVLNFEGRFIMTTSRTYHVGKAHPAWLAWLKENGRTFRPENPLHWL